jgi:hypothetical protein
MLDPAAIESFRRHIEARTTTIMATYTFIGLVVGVLLMLGLFGHDGQYGAVGSMALGVLGAGVGYILGGERAFGLRLQAQMTLFQAHIEANTERFSFDAAPTRVNPPPRSLLVKAGLRLN